jgi:hypothetical protein
LLAVTGKAGSAWSEVVFVDVVEDVIFGDLMIALLLIGRD